jgi:hypothetical protein
MAVEVELAAGLEGDGSVVFVEFAAPVDHAAPPFRHHQSDPWPAAPGDRER